MGEGVLIGLDVGTTSSKAVVYTPEGRALAGGRAPTIWSSTPSGVEMAARDLLAGAIEAVDQALAKTSSVAVRRLNIGEWIVLALGGEEASELSLASRTGWLDLTARTWWAESVSATEMKESLLPPLVTAGTALGRVANIEVSTALAGAVLTVAGHDHQAAAVGVGAIQEGDELDSCGTAEALVRTVQPNLPEETIAELARAGITTGWHVLAQHWCLLGGTEGGRTLQRVRALLGEGGEDLDALDAAALAVSPSEVRGLVLEVTPERVGVRCAKENTRPEHIWRLAGTRDQRGEVDPRGDVQAFGPTSSAGCDRRVEQQSRAAIREARHARPVGAPRCQPGRLSGGCPPRGAGRRSV